MAGALLYEKTIKVEIPFERFNEMQDATLDKIIQRMDDLLEDDPLDDAVAQFRKEYPDFQTTVD